VPTRWQVLLYNQTEARVAMHAHFPLAGPVLRRLEDVGDWEQWRTLVALALLYHHGGVLVPVGVGGREGGVGRPTRSMDCVWREGEGRGGGRADGLMMVLGDGEAREEEQKEGGVGVVDDQGAADGAQVDKGHDKVGEMAEQPAWLFFSASSPFSGNDSLSFSASSYFFSSSTSSSSLSSLSSSPSSPAFAPHFPGVLAAPWHDPALQAVVEQLFFSAEALDGLREARALSERQWLSQRLRGHDGKGGQEGEEGGMGERHEVMVLQALQHEAATLRQRRTTEGEKH